MCVEQDGPGLRVILGVFYEVERSCAIAEWNSGRPHPGMPAPAAGNPAFLGAFVTMELEHGAGDLAGRGLDSLGCLVHEQQHWRDKGGSRLASSAARAALTARGLLA